MSAFWCVAPSHSWIVMNLEINPVQILSKDEDFGNNGFLAIIHFNYDKKLLV